NFKVIRSTRSRDILLWASITERNCLPCIVSFRKFCVSMRDDVLARASYRPEVILLDDSQASQWYYQQSTKLGELSLSRACTKAISGIEAGDEKSIRRIPGLRSCANLERVIGEEFL